MVFSGGGKLVLIGIALGVAGAFAIARLLESQLFGVTPTDGRVLAAVALVLAAVAALALFLPARRAASIDPMSALRQS
jgi:ABC-type antimicrobial peptide transport system permease subunit